MYEYTDKQFICYKYNNLHYKVPTYGKIYKIIDFGRAIYSHSNKYFVVIVFMPKEMQILNITLSHILMIKNQD